MVMGKAIFQGFGTMPRFSDIQVITFSLTTELQSIMGEN